MSVKINSLQLENVKRVKAVAMEPSESGLTIIGGDNGQGKTSVLDAIAWALGGNKYKPSMPARQGSVVPPKMTISLSNGLVVERKGENGTLKVTDPSGQKAGQQLLDAFVEKLALDLPKFMESSDADKAQTLLNIIGVGPQLMELEKQIKEIYNERTAIGRIADQKKAHAAEMPFYPGLPETPISASELIKQQQDILAKNGAKAKIRENADKVEAECRRAEQRIHDREWAVADAEKRLEETKTRLQEAIAEYNELQEMKAAAFADATAVGDDIDTSELAAALENVEETNRRIQANLDREKAEEDAEAAAAEYQNLTDRLEDIREQKKALLDGAKLPLPGLSVEDGKLLYQGQAWDNMSGSERLIVSAAIVKELNPECGFVLMDRLEQLDLHTLQIFGKWLEDQGLQVIATRVSTGAECSVIIEDGYSIAAKDEMVTPMKDWKGGF